MEKNLETKSLIKTNNEGIFYKIKMFFKNLFKKNKHEIEIEQELIMENKNDIEKESIIENKNEQIKKTKFIEDVKNVENEETKLLKLQKKYESGEINSKMLSKEQVITLQKLYEKQIEELRKSNEYREQKLLQYRKKMQVT